MNTIVFSNSQLKTLKNGINFTLCLNFKKLYNQTKNYKKIMRTTRKKPFKSLQYLYVQNNCKYINTHTHST